MLSKHAHVDNEFGSNLSSSDEKSDLFKNTKLDNLFEDPENIQKVLEKFQEADIQSEVSCNCEKAFLEARFWRT